MIIRILEAHVPKQNLTLRIFHFHSTVVAEDIDIRIHDLQETLDASHTPLELLRKLHDPADGSDQHIHIEDIQDQVRRP